MDEYGKATLDALQFLVYTAATLASIAILHGWAWL